MRRLMLWLAFLSAMLGFSGIAQAAGNVLFESEPGDLIGQGQTQTLGKLSVQLIRSSNGDELNFGFRSSGARYSARFAVPRGHTFTPGRYPAAQAVSTRSPVAPGIDVRGAGRSCDQISGWFEVREISIVGDAVNNLAINFRQNCNGSAAALNGAIRFNSALPLETAQLRAVAGPDDEVRTAGRTVLDGRQSFSRTAGGVTGFSWTQVSGTPVTLVNALTPTPEFAAPDSPPGGETLRFALTVTDSTGLNDTDEVAILVRSVQDNKTFVSIDGSRGEFVTGGQGYEFNPTNADLQFTANAANGVEGRIDGSSFFTLDFAGPDNQRLQVGSYENAQLYPFQAAGQPGISVSGNGRSCSTATGRFDVIQAEYNPDGSPRVLAINFEQRCNGAAAALSGRLRFNALPGAPIASAGPDRTVTRGSLVELDGRGSTDPIGTIVSYQWTQVGGPPDVEIRNANHAVASFRAPLLTRKTLLTFQLRVIDNIGHEDTDTVDIIVGVVRR